METRSKMTLDISEIRVIRGSLLNSLTTGGLHHIADELVNNRLGVCCKPFKKIEAFLNGICLYIVHHKFRRILAVNLFYLGR